MENFLKKGFYYTVKPEHDDECLISASNFFLSKLEKEVLEFRQELYEKEEDYNSTISKKDNNKKIIYTPEVLTRKSPMTMLDAKWGSGKTHFIEKLLENMQLNKLENDYFKNAILIDAWKLSLTGDMVDDLFSEIFLQLSSVNEKLKNDFVSFAKWTFNTIGRPWIKRFGIDINKVPNKPDYENSIEKINETIEPTIIFIDNIERVGPEAWSILKAISRIQYLENFVIVLPINLSKFQTNESLNDNEFPIEKYIDIKYFNFEQDYIGMLKEIGFNDGDAKFFNSVLNEPINETLLSIREAKKRIVSNRILHFKDQVDRDINFVLEIWGAISILNQELFSMFDESVKLSQTVYDHFEKIIIHLRKMNSDLPNAEEIVEGINAIMEQTESFKNFQFRDMSSFAKRLAEEYGKLYETSEKFILKNNKRVLATTEKCNESKKSILKIKTKISNLNEHKSNLRNKKNILISEVYDLRHIVDNNMDDDSLTKKHLGEIQEKENEILSIEKDSQKIHEEILEVEDFYSREKEKNINLELKLSDLNKKNINFIKNWSSPDQVGQDVKKYVEEFKRFKKNVSTTLLKNIAKVSSEMTGHSKIDNVNAKLKIWPNVRENLLSVFNQK